MAAVHTTVIIPAYNEEAYLDACLQSLHGQTAAKPFEIIVVDNGSTDGTAEIARRHGVRVVGESKQGVCAARQSGFKHAKGGIIVSSDADCTYPAGWLQAIQDDFDRLPDVSVRVGTYRFADGSPALNLFLAGGEALALRLHYAFGWQPYVSASNLAFRRELFQGYDTRLTQGGDELYVVRQLRKTGRVLYRPGNPVKTSGRRLRQGLLRTLFVDFIAKYLVNYAVTRRWRRNVFGSYRAHRQAPSHRQQIRQARSWLVTAEAGLLLGGSLMLVLYGLYKLLTSDVSAPRLGAWLLLNAGLLAYLMCSARSQAIMPAPFRIWTKQKLVALTFDDGPNSPFTEEIADIIESYGGRATFFQCGANIARRPETTRRLSAAGHTIGNHTYSHRFLTLWRPRQLASEIAATNQLIQANTGAAVRFFRAPWLVRHPWLGQMLRRQGLLPVSGLLATRHEARQRDGGQMAASCLKQVRPGAIIIFHDGRETRGGDRAQTVRAVRAVCQALDQQGYRLVSLDSLL